MHNLLKFLEVFKQVQINIPFLDAIQQVPSYAKFLKDLVTIKRKTNVLEESLFDQASELHPPMQVANQV
jgi:hypothetical protein